MAYYRNYPVLAYTCSDDDVDDVPNIDCNLDSYTVTS